MNRFGPVSTVSQELLSRVAWWALAVLLLTTIHHVYGAYVYDTPWRLHVAFVSGFGAAAIVGSLVVLRRRADDVMSEIAFWALVGVTLVLAVVLIGLFEGGYNHGVKNALYFAGASPALMNSLFPPTTYELPNDVFFEVTGVLQVVPGIVAGWLLYRLVRARFNGAIATAAIPPQM